MLPYPGFSPTPFVFPVIVPHTDFCSFGPVDRHHPFRHQSPYADVFEDDKALVVVMELPGLTKDDFKLELKGHTLTISGNVPVSTLIPGTSSATPSPSQATADQIPEADAAEPEEKFKVHERLHGRFEKGFVVPYGTEEKDISATIQHGLLRVRVAKVEGRGGFTKLVRVLSH